MAFFPLPDDDRGGVGNLHKDIAVNCNHQTISVAGRAVTIAAYIEQILLSVSTNTSVCCLCHLYNSECLDNTLLSLVKLYYFRFIMPKAKESTTSRLKSIVLEYGTNIFKTNGTILFCKLCEVKVNSDRKFVVTQHVNTEKHKRTAIRKNEKNTDTEVQQLVIITPKKCLFSHHLCKALLSGNIPLCKITIPELKLFLEKYTLSEVPTDSALCKTYVNDI